MTVDTEKYLEFVQEVTSAPSTDLAALLEIVKLNENVQKLTIHKVNAPLDQETVDVTATGIAELPGQQGLPKAKERLPFEPLEEELGLPQSELYEF